MYKFQIFSIFEDEFTERLVKVNRKAIKNGFDEFVAEISRERDDDERLVSTIVVNCDLPQFNGWSLNSAIDFVTSGEITESLTRTAPGKQLPQNFDNVDAKKCDHCGIRHHRNRLFVIEHENGKIMQVGLNCMEDFLGKDAASLISDFWLIDFEAEFGEGGSEDDLGCDSKYALDLYSYLCDVKLVIAAYGWMSKSRAEEAMVEATAFVAYDMSDKEKRSKAIDLANANPHKKDYEISDATEWAQSQSGNDYLDNIASIARLEIVPRKYDGYAASILAAHERHLEQESEKKIQNETAVPALGGRQIVEGTILSVKEKWGDYGMQLKMTLMTTGGWKLYGTLPKAINTAKRGDKISLTVTVKPSYKDEFFAFGSRPAKATIV